MYKNILICWIFGRVNLFEEEIRKFCALIPSAEKEDWVKIIENGDLENHQASVAEIAQQDFIVEATDFIVDERVIKNANNYFYWKDRKGKES